MVPSRPKRNPSFLSLGKLSCVGKVKTIKDEKRDESGVSLKCTSSSRFFIPITPQKGH